MSNPSTEEEIVKKRSDELYALLTEVQNQRQTADQLERLVQAKNLEIKSMLLRHANECEELTGFIEEFKTVVKDLESFKEGAELFMAKEGCLQYFYQWQANRKG